MTRILLLLSTLGLLAACAGAAGESAESAAPDDPRAVAEAYLAATEGDAERGAVEDQLAACFAARRLLRSGYAEGDATRRDRDALALAARVYHRLPSLPACAEAPMMAGLAFQRGWLPADDPEAAARQSFRHLVAAMRFHGRWIGADREPAMAPSEALRVLTDVPAPLFDAALEGAQAQEPWIARILAGGLPARYEAAMRARFGVGQPAHRGLATALTGYPDVADRPAAERRLAGLMLTTTAENDFDAEFGLGLLVRAAWGGDGIAAALYGRHLLAEGEVEEALAWLLVAAVSGGPALAREIAEAESALSEAERRAARVSASTRLSMARTKR
ncbi:MAG: hypothetical protein NXI21_00890 [Alphaproteobacteria bacterium]|nr:hypothetical protein [Alphaproteobacteria bacterium]